MLFCHSRDRQTQPSNIMRRLRTAEEIGWLAEFPEDVWSVLMLAISFDKDDMLDFGFMLILLNTCKMFYRLLQKSLIAIVGKFDISQQFLGPQSFNKIHWLFDVLDAYSPVKNLRGYLQKMASHDLYHLSNCLSLLHLASLSSHHLQLSNQSTFIRFYAQHSPFILGSARLESFRGEIGDGYVYYVDHDEKRIRMFSKLPVLRVVVSFDSLYRQAVLIASKKNDKILLESVEQCDVACRNYYARLVRLVTDAGERVETRKVHKSDNIDACIVLIDNQQHYLFSYETRDFRTQCLVFPVSVKYSYTAYLLDKYHQRNWDRVLKTDRYLIMNK